MIIDNELLFADGTWAPTATGDNISPNVHDTSPVSGIGTGGTNTGRDFGQGEELWFRVLVTQTVTSGGAATVDFRFRTDSAASLVSSPVDLVASGAIAKATLVAGYTFNVRLPSASYKRYIGANANIGTAVLTAGKFHVAITKNIQGNTKYASSFGLDV